MEMVAYFAKHTDRVGYFGRPRAGRPVDRQRCGGGAGATDRPAADCAGLGPADREHRRDGGVDRDGRDARVGRPQVPTGRLTARIESYTRRREPVKPRKQVHTMMGRG